MKTTTNFQPMYFHKLGPLGRVVHRVAMSVCVSQNFWLVFFLLHITEYLGMVIQILKLEEHQHFPE